MSRVALVTGGTRGIGAEISRELKSAGRHVVASYAGNDAAAKAFVESTGITVMKFDAGDFADIVVHNQSDIDMAKLGRLAEQVYRGGRAEITKLVDDILAGRRIVI